MVNNMEYIIIPTYEKITLPDRGYFKYGDTGNSIAIISSFLATNFMGYETKLGVKINDMLGYAFGKNLKAWIIEFQKQNDLEPDGNIGPITLNKLREYGLSL